MNAGEAGGELVSIQTSALLMTSWLACKEQLDLHNKTVQSFVASLSYKGSADHLTDNCNMVYRQKLQLTQIQLAFLTSHPDPPLTCLDLKFKFPPYLLPSSDRFSLNSKIIGIRFLVLIHTYRASP